MVPQILSIEPALIPRMQTTVWKATPPESDSRQRSARGKRKLVVQVLRDAYRRHVRDSITRQAVKQALGA
jgi:hypothetical protein